MRCLVLAVMVIVMLMTGCSVWAAQSDSPGSYLSVGYKAYKAGNLKTAYSYWGAAAQTATPEGAEANYRLALCTRKYKGDPGAQLEYFRRAYSVDSRIRSDAGLGCANTYLSMGNRASAREMFVRLAKECPDIAPTANFKAAMCFLGDSRADKVNRPALRKLAKGFFAKVATPDSAIQLLGMSWEDALDGIIPWDGVERDLKNYSSNYACAPRYAKARALLMLAERYFAKDANEEALKLTKQIVDDYPECKTESAWALYVQGGVLQELGRREEAIDVYDGIVANYGDADNFKGNNVEAGAIYWKVDCLKKLGRVGEAGEAVDFFHATWPTEPYFSQFITKEVR